MSAASAAKPQRSFWIAVICGAVILTIGIGARQSFGIFQKPIAADLNVGRELWSFANALVGAADGALSPFVGNLADRFGTARTVAAGGVLYVIGMFMIAFATEGVMLTVGNVVSGIGMAAAGFGPIFGAISRQTPAENRSVALGVTTAGGSFGQFAVVPFASLLQQRLDNWHTTMLILAAVMSMSWCRWRSACASRAPRRRSRAPVRRRGTDGRAAGGVRRRRVSGCSPSASSCAASTSPSSACICPSYISDKAVGMSFFGTPDLGDRARRLGDRPGRPVQHRRLADLGLARQADIRSKDMLALLYALRALAFLMFLALPLSWMSVLLFAATLGFLWLGTVPLTSGLVGYMFGPIHMSMLWGIVFFSHQLGSFLGGWGAGRLYDIQGNYDLMWWISMGLGLAAALIHWLIRERPVPRLMAAASSAAA